MKIVLANEGPRIEAAALGERPLGGVETAFALLAQAFAQRGHHLTTHFEGEAGPLPAQADLVIAARVPRLFRALPRGQRVLWLHNPGGYLRKPRHLWPLLRARPMLVTLGPSHAATLAWFLPGRRFDIPLAVTPPFDAPAAERAPPPPIAAFTSNPLRGLAWLAALWPRIGVGELHAWSGAATYGGRLPAAASAALDFAAGTPSVHLHAPLPRPALREALLRARVVLHPGDTGETFCLALAEAQALGLPCVVMNRGAVAERVQHGVTGLIAEDEAGFIAATRRLLTDDTTWLAMHRAALARGPGPTWQEIAARFEALA